MRAEPTHPTIALYYARATAGNAVRVDMSPTLAVWFSYTTPVAFRLGPPSVAPVVRQNAWSATTGRHLDAIDGGADALSARLDGATWERRYRRALGPRTVAALDGLRVEIVPDPTDPRVVVEYARQRPPLVEFHRTPGDGGR